ncbi:hypothetical protein ACHHYP_11821 [Achlya hypogyna]|uniref:SWIM-type domain-containing protein n=1 Tax=Achlya hypogyna TaxID=1202772 RepID=A0A1V9YIA5_ACHHY|nr:hypothetical protein ACHHYP_11821 [Achlya hypogyna]
MLKAAMDSAATRANEVALMDKNRVLTPYAAAEFAKQKAEATNYVVKMATRDEYLVNRNGYPLMKKRVHVEGLTCTCSYRDQMQMPCRHLIRVLVHVGRRDRLLQCFHSMFHFQNYSKAVNNLAFRLPLLDNACNLSEARPQVGTCNFKRSYLWPDTAPMVFGLALADMLNPTIESDSDFNEESSSSSDDN